MRIVSWNVNGIRAAIRKGIDGYFDSIDADIWMLQEVRALPEQLPKGWNWPEGYTIHLHPAEKKGYSGVATLSRTPMEISQVGKAGQQDPNDSEGRVIVSTHGDFTCINTYLPSGSNKVERQQFKEAWMEEWRQFIKPYLKMKTPVIVCGDLNIAHTEDDIWNPKGNAKQSGFLPHEREWFSELLNDGWHDAFREYVGEGVKTYSWWSNRGQARVKDRGWRIDYFLLNPAANKRVKSVSIKREGGLEISDHAPVILELED
ncbi:MAG: exodeoxyribonuclease III [Euryarchaeota archaeon]|jgi:exodeoxyribonuclease-3|nr:exodeoxyribonuclease III [Euryarchaeota archaeon]